MLALFLPFKPAASPDSWSALAAGIDFQLFHLASPRPINLFTARLNRAEPTAIIDTAIAQGRLVEGREQISEMAARYDQAINYWGESWGQRNRVVVTINGYFFNLSTGRPLSGQIQSGWYAQRFSDYVGDAGFAWNLDRSAMIGKCVYHTPRFQFFTILRSGETRKINGVNLERDMDELILYTPQYDAATGTDNNGVEVLVEMSRPTLVLPEPAMALGKVVKIRDWLGNTPIPFDHVVLSATGESRTGLLSRLQDGDEIGFSQEITDCSGSPVKNWTKTYAATGGDYHFLTNGALTIDESNPDAFSPNSRTAVAYNANYVYFIVIDGWNPGVSEGISIRELGVFARDTLGATDAVTLDSGGSSTMVVYGQVINNTTCNFTRECGSGAEVNAPDLEPLVGNALMMVAVEPRILANIFQPDQVVTTDQAAELRLGPGTNYAFLTNLVSGAQGIALGMRYDDINGVLAKGAYWQRVKFGLQTGWIRQDALVREPPPGLPRSFLPLIRR